MKLLRRLGPALVILATVMAIVLLVAFRNGRTPTEDEWYDAVESAYAGDSTACERFLQAGWDPDRKDTPTGMSMVAHALGTRNGSLLALCLEYGASREPDWGKEWRLIHYAAERGVPDHLKVLLEHGAELDVRTADGLAPIHIAARYGNAETLRCLAESVADVDMRDHQRGATAMHWAVWHNSHPRACVDILRNTGADVNARENEGNTPLHWAVYNGAEAVGALLDAGADIGRMNDADQTPYDVAAQSRPGLAPLLRNPGDRSGSQGQ